MRSVSQANTAHLSHNKGVPHTPGKLFLSLARFTHSSYKERGEKQKYGFRTKHLTAEDAEDAEKIMVQRPTSKVQSPTPMAVQATSNEKRENNGH